MKKEATIILMILLMLGLMIPITVWATPGEDVHSGTMNVEADGESIKSKQSKETRVDDVEVTEEKIQVEIEQDKAKADEEFASESAEPDDDEKEATLFRSSILIYIVLSGGIAILVIFACKKRGRG